MPPKRKKTKDEEVVVDVVEGGGEGGESNKKARVEESGGGSAAAAAAPAVNSATPLDGCRIVTTGDFDMGRFGVENLVRKLGGEVVPNISRTTKYLILGRKGTGQFGVTTGPGTKKHKEAKKLKIEIVDEKWLENLERVATGGGGAAAADGADASCPPSDSIESLWNKVKELHLQLHHSPLEKENSRGATDEEIAAAEKHLGFSLPTQMKQLYKLSDGVGGQFEKMAGLAKTFDSISFAPMKRFMKSLKIVGLVEYQYVASNGIIFEWDVSFDGQCGNTIVADSFADLLKNWTRNLQEAIDAGNDKLRGYNSYRIKDEPEIDKSDNHRSFFSAFKANYERNFGKWPVYMS